MTRRLGNPAVLQAHADAVHGCELAPFLACCGGHGETQIHHVLHGAANRIDAAWNLVSVCRQAHDWCHRDTVGGMVLCWHVIHLRGQLDLEAIHEFWRRNPRERIAMTAETIGHPLQRIAAKLLEVYGE